MRTARTLSPVLPPDWPHAAASHFTDTRAAVWHVQRLGTAGPQILLIHGAGGSTHSWRDLMAPLAASAQVLAFDLPGHGWTRTHTPMRSGLGHMAVDCADLLRAEDFAPDLIVAHSAGAAVALQMLVDSGAPTPVLGLNAALMPFSGLAGVLFPPLARALTLNPFAAPVLARLLGRPGAVRGLVENIGSTLTEEGLGYYKRLMSDRDHVAGALRMMARWDLEPLIVALPRIAAPVTFAVGLRDKSVPPETSRKAARRLPDARVIDIAGLGHLMHEEDPEQFVDLIREVLSPTA